MRIAFGTDESTPVTDHIVARLRALGHQVDVVADPAPWPEVGHGVGKRVADGVDQCGIVCCWTGTGVALAANKVSGVRAALCADAVTAVGARRWNDANVLALSLRLTTAALADEVIDAFLTTDVDAEELALIRSIEPAP